MRGAAKVVLGIGAATVIASSVLYAGTNDPVVQKREQNQQQRIDQGMKSGQLTQGEAARLERREANIQRDEARMKSDGNLSPRERRKLAREQNRASRDIYRKKHNARKAE